MPTHGEPQRAAIDSRDLEHVLGLLDERVIRCGVPNDVYTRTSATMAGGGTGHPVVLAEVGDSVVIDPRPEPPLPFPLHQGFTFRGDRVVLIQDYLDRARALADVGL